MKSCFKNSSFLFDKKLFSVLKKKISKTTKNRNDLQKSFDLK